MVKILLGSGKSLGKRRRKQDAKDLIEQGDCSPWDKKGGQAAGSRPQTWKSVAGAH